MRLDGHKKWPRGRPLALQEADVDFVRLFLRRLRVSHEALDDLVQDVLERAVRSSTYDPNLPLRPWLSGISLRVVRNFRRHAWERLRRSNDLEIAVDPRSTPDQMAMSAEEQRLLVAALLLVPPRKRDLLQNYYLDERCLSDLMASSPAVSSHTWHSRLRLARRSLRHALARVGIVAST